MERTPSYLIKLSFGILFLLSACSQPQKDKPKKTYDESIANIMGIMDTSKAGILDHWSYNDMREMKTFYKVAASAEEAYALNVLPGNLVSVDGNIDSFYSDFGINRKAKKEYAYRLRFERFNTYTLHQTILAPGEFKTIDSIGAEQYANFYTKQDLFKKIDELSEFFSSLIVKEAFKNTKYGYTVFILNSGARLNYLPDGIEKTPLYIKDELEYAKKNGKYITKNWCLFEDKESNK
ncbi:hypothetical protein ACQ33O_06730 [Ferruginibacter sp. SUN002]|uniref:hypothetical protein n=1 Tax=Ferruginibacter sp. SUN002 TaxID=2937789 RepID=UPI003D3643DF